MRPCSLFSTRSKWIAILFHYWRSGELVIAMSVWIKPWGSIFQIISGSRENSNGTYKLDSFRANFFISMYIQSKFITWEFRQNQLWKRLLIKFNRNPLKFVWNKIQKWPKWKASETEIMDTSGSPPLATFLEYLSLLQQDMKDEKKRTSTILAFSILSLITEGKLTFKQYQNYIYRWNYQTNELISHWRVKPEVGRNLKIFDISAEI